MRGSLPPPDPTSPSEIAAAVFPTVRKGFDPHAVRAFLRTVADELSRARDAERAASAQVSDLEERLAKAVALDEAVLTQALGEEATRVLQVAREAATATRERAESDAARLLEQVEIEVTTRRSAIAGLVEAEVEQAKEQGRQMVEEARQYRERVLADVARRREAARQQIELLTTHRDQVAMAFDAARRAAVEVLEQLGPVPFDDVADDELAPEPEPQTPAPAPMVEVVETIEVVEIIEVEEVEEVVEVDEIVEVVEDDVVVEVEETVDDVEPTDVVRILEPEPEPVVHHPPTRPTAPVIALFGSKAEPPRPPVDEVAEETPQSVVRGVDDLFARLRASSPDLVARDVADPPPPPEEPAAHDEELSNPFDDRDAVLTPLILSVSRRLKRVLADQQNLVLDAVRRGGVDAAERLVNASQEHLEQSVVAIADDLQQAAWFGARSVASPGDSDHDVRSRLDDSVIEPARDWLWLEVLAPLRDRLVDVLHAADGDVETFTTRAKHVFREWKSQRIDEHVDDLVRLAHGRGLMRGLVPGVPVCWLVDPSGPGCPDAEDNALAGVVGAGDEFPTGHRHPPAHSGCRCLVAPVAG